MTDGAVPRFGPKRLLRHLRPNAWRSTAPDHRWSVRETALLRPAPCRLEDWNAALARLPADPPAGSASATIAIGSGPWFDWAALPRAQLPASGTKPKRRPRSTMAALRS